MKNELTCGVVADLLPSFVEGLTSEETNRAVEAHVAACPVCAAKLAAMGGPETDLPAETEKEVDYLKTVKKQTWKKVLAAVVCTVLVIVLGCAAKLFVIGEPADGAGMAWSCETTKTELHLNVHATESAMAYGRWQVAQKDGVVTIRGWKFPVSLLYRSGDYQTAIPLDGVREVWLGGKLIWQDGMVISPKTLALLDAKTPYVGDAPAVGRIAQLLEVQNQVDGYTTELRTSREPFFWQFNFTGDLSLTQDSRMTGLAYQMLALVGNLDEVHWAEGQRSISLAQVNRALENLTSEYNSAHGTSWKVKASVRDYTVSPADYQQLREILAYKFGELE